MASVLGFSRPLAIREELLTGFPERVAIAADPGRPACPALLVWVGGSVLRGTLKPRLQGAKGGEWVSPPQVAVEGTQLD